MSRTTTPNFNFDIPAGDNLDTPIEKEKGAIGKGWEALKQKYNSAAEIVNLKTWDKWKVLKEQKGNNALIAQREQLIADIQGRMVTGQRNIQYYENMKVSETARFEPAIASITDPEMKKLFKDNLDEKLDAADRNIQYTQNVMEQMSASIHHYTAEIAAFRQRIQEAVVAFTERLDAQIEHIHQKHRYEEWQQYLAYTHAGVNQCAAFVAQTDRQIGEYTGYLLTARRLGVKTQDCQRIEAGIAGFRVQRKEGVDMDARYREKFYLSQRRIQEINAKTANYEALKRELNSDIIVPNDAPVSTSIEVPVADLKKEANLEEQQEEDPQIEEQEVVASGDDIGDTEDSAIPLGMELGMAGDEGVSSLQVSEEDKTDVVETLSQSIQSDSEKLDTDSRTELATTGTENGPVKLRGEMLADKYDRGESFVHDDTEALNRHVARAKSKKKEAIKSKRSPVRAVKNQKSTKVIESKNTLRREDAVRLWDHSRDIASEESSGEGFRTGFEDFEFPENPVDPVTRNAEIQEERIKEGASKQLGEIMFRIHDTLETSEIEKIWEDVKALREVFVGNKDLFAPSRHDEISKDFRLIQQGYLNRDTSPENSVRVKEEFLRDVDALINGALYDWVSEYGGIAAVKEERVSRLQSAQQEEARLPKESPLLETQENLTPSEVSIDVKTEEESNDQGEFELEAQEEKPNHEEIRDQLRGMVDNLSKFGSKRNAQTWAEFTKLQEAIETHRDLFGSDEYSFLIECFTSIKQLYSLNFVSKFDKEETMEFQSDLEDKIVGPIRRIIGNR